MREHRSNAWSPGGVVLAAAAVAAGWLAADDVGFRDAGELGAAGFGLGVAHPTGFAVDLLLLRASALVPLGHVAFRQNALTALEAALCAGLLAAISTRLAERCGARAWQARLAGALIPIAALGGWATFVRSARTTEVYGSALLAVALAAYGLVRGGRAQGLGLCVIGLAPGLHVTAGLYASLLVGGACLQRGARSASRFVLARAPALLACSLVIAYLPLASLRDPPIDWGDPQSPGRVLAHLTAARIRSAYHSDMLGSSPESVYRIAGQWLELWPALVLAAVALALGLRHQRLALLAPAALVVADLAYAAWINPMGAGDRQVGHVAGAALAVLAGIGAALSCARAPERLRSAALVAIAALAVALPLRLPRSELSDGYAAGELLGSGGPLSALPPRSIVVCDDDDSCAAGLFARFVEQVRPDLSVVPAQHLWDPTVARQLYGTSLPRAREPAERERAAVANHAVRRLASGQEPRPVVFSNNAAWTRAGAAGRVRASDHPPYLQREPARAPPSALLRELDRVRAARFAGEPPRAQYARDAWCNAYSALGTGLLAVDPRSAAAALVRATELAPARASAWTNLGVALEASGDLAGAERSAVRAIELDPRRPTAWVNLARLRLARGGKPAARDALELARRAGVRDPRLDALAAQVRDADTLPR